MELSVEVGAWLSDGLASLLSHQVTSLGLLFITYSCNHFTREDAPDAFSRTHPPAPCHTSLHPTLTLLAI